MKQRNPNATCGNCPFWGAVDPETHYGRCQYGHAYQWDRTSETEWCGQHPDFWAEDEAPRHDPGVLAMQALGETDGRKEAENERD